MTEQRDLREIISLGMDFLNKTSDASRDARLMNITVFTSQIYIIR